MMSHAQCKAFLREPRLRAVLSAMWRSIRMPFSMLSSPGHSDSCVIAVPGKVHDV